MTIPNLQKFPSRDEWLRARARTLGASDAPIILGLLPWRAPLTLWCSMKNGTAAVEETRAMRMGRAQERAVIKEYALETGRKVRWSPNTLIERATDDGAFAMHASPDAVVEGERPRLVEAKVSADLQGWADAAPPLYVQAQVQAALWCLQWDVADIVAYIGGRDLKIFTLEADASAQAVIVEKMRTFKESLAGDEPPWGMIDGSDATREAVNALWKERRAANAGAIERVAELDATADALVAIREQRKALDALARERENVIIAAIAERKVEGVEAAGHIFKMEERQRKPYVVEAATYTQLSTRKIKGE